MKAALRIVPALLAALALLASCTTATRTGGAGASTGGEDGGGGGSGGAALVESLPAGCDGVAAPPTSTSVAFAAAGRVWAVSPGRPSDLHCLFPAAQPGLFSWGPRGDRVVLTGLAVHGVGSPAARPAGSFAPSYFTWSRPTGTTIWFTDQSQTHVFRADIGTSGARDITPMPGVTYGDMAYHPSGLAVGFVAHNASNAQTPTAIWMSTNQGADARLLVQAPSGITFGHIVFAHDGTGLYYSIDAATGTHQVARYDLTTGQVSGALWSGGSPVGGDMVELAGVPGLGLTVGSSCADHTAVFAPLDGTAGTVLDPGVPGPVSMVGRVDGQHFVVAVGGCNGAPSDLYVVSRDRGHASLLVRGVTASGMRLPEPSPPPALPPALPRSGFA